MDIPVPDPVKDKEKEKRKKQQEASWKSWEEGPKHGGEISLTLDTLELLSPRRKKIRMKRRKGKMKTKVPLGWIGT